MARHFCVSGEHPHMVICGVQGVEALDCWMAKLDMKNIGFKPFYEPDIGNQITALATEPVPAGKRRIFSKLKLLEGGE